MRKFKHFLVENFCLQNEDFFLADLQKYRSVITTISYLFFCMFVSMLITFFVVKLLTSFKKKCLDLLFWLQIAVWSTLKVTNDIHNLLR